MGDDGQSGVRVGEQVPKKGEGEKCLQDAVVVFSHVWRIPIVRHGSTIDSTRYPGMLPIIMDGCTTVTMSILAANTNKDWCNLLPAFRGWIIGGCPEHLSCMNA